MAESTRYFQLTQDILVEYNYTTPNILNNQLGDVSDKLVDLKNLSIMTLDNEYDGTKYFCIKDSAKSGIYADKSRFVVPINKSKTKFVKYSSGDYTYQDKDKLKYKDWESGLSDVDIVYDRVRLHFTNRNFMGDYDGLILQGNIYRTDKSKVSLFSFYINRLDSVSINENPMIINQKLYTTYIDFKLPSVESLLTVNDDAHKWLRDVVLNEGTFSLMKNSSISFDIYGIKSTYDSRNFNSNNTYKYICEYNCEQLNSIRIPSKDSYDELSVSIKEAYDGDYFVINTLVSSGESLSDFLYNYTDNPESFIILHELSLTEYYVDNYNKLRSNVTHKEHYMVNAAIDRDGEIVINEEGLDSDFLYRPICRYGSKCIRFTIEDSLKIIDTLNNTTIVKKSSIDYDKPYKYGKHMNKIFLSEMPMNVNVYNKRNNQDDSVVGVNDEDINFIKIPGGNSSENAVVKVENHQHSIVAFVESANIGVSIEQVAMSDIESFE